ncbi:UxaA family hydrolase [Ructibacterium gallinarum]|uniref:Altronate dehydratase n=1 Tax=Ructibacterium gallinarum TaxID=2779355 RepID=A0A9D5M6P0_9FIRM|nr:altronate dehydratase family protein [Ructibacterium gallinarum]MBE5040502.1 altronate dehydratase [Ructibacterium gallinarum]
MEQALRINQNDNVEINLRDGHKYAICDIAEGENIIKYGCPIGHASCDIKKGEHVHTHNVKTNLSGKFEYSYNYKDYSIEPIKTNKTFMGYRRKNGDVGIRNDVWIVNTVGCVNKVAQRLSEATGAKYFPHPFGCSQLGDDQRITQLILKGMVNHPNAGGVLVLGLGCENNNIDAFKDILGEYDSDRVKFLNCQDENDEIAKGIEIINDLKAYADTFRREPISISELKIGLKCGGSDGYSGITANPLVGRLSDKLIAYGGGCVLTEVPEMFGAEQLLMERCESEDIFNKAVDLINNFKEYYERHNQVIYENPSPGNKKGGITTLEEKSLGCVQKGGLARVVDVLDYGDRISKNGLALLNGPGNDIVAITNLMAAGVHMILFTTGRGTPVGSAVPTVKIATNSELAKKKANWIDFDAGECLNGKDLSDELLEYIIAVASGEQTKNEINGYCEISIFKDGVVL